MNDNKGLKLVSDRPGSDDQAVAKLLRLAGHRPEVPADHAAAVQQAARAEWRRAVRAERHRRYFYRGAGGLLAAAAAVALVVGTGLLDRGLPGTREQVATVEVVAGPARAVTGVAKPGTLVPDQILLSDTVVETPADGRAAFQLADGTSIRLDVDTRVRFLSGHQLELQSGAVYADSGPEAGGGLEIHTELGVARDVGTQFEVRLDDEADSLKVRVREGEVVLASDAVDKPLRVHAGFELAIKSDGSVTHEAILSHGEPWDWTLAVVPPFDAENPTVKEILEWAKRESGWQLSYADPSLAHLAATVPLQGASIAGMNPAQAAESAVLALGLSYRLEDGVLVVGSAEP